MTVFLVTRGEYNDYRVVAVYLTHAEADAMVLHLNGPEATGYGTAQVEEWEVGPPVPQTGCYVAIVTEEGVLD